MAVPSMNAAIGWKPQSAQGVAATGEFYWHKAQNSNFSIVEQIRPLPPELGGGLLPDGVTKTAYWTKGRIDFVPRLQQHIGWLLWSLAGSGALTGNGPYQHLFPGRADDIIPDNWLTFRRLVPNADGTMYGETFTDCKVTGFTLRAVPGQLLTCSVNVSGLTAAATDPAAGVGWAPMTDNSGYESYSGIPIATVGGFEMPKGMALNNINSAALTIDNGPADDAAMLVLGSYSPHTVLPLARSIRIEVTAFWTGATIYKNVYMNGGTSWSPIIFTGYSPFEMYFHSPSNLPNKAYPGTIGFYAAPGAISWTVTPLELRGGDVILLNMVGMVNAVTSGDAWEIYLKNGRSSLYAP